MSSARDLLEKPAMCLPAETPMEAPTPSTVSLTSSKLRRSVPRVSSAAVNPAKPALSSGSARLPAGKYPLTTTAGLVKFSRTSATMPLGSSRRTMC